MLMMVNNLNQLIEEAESFKLPEGTIKYKEQGRQSFIEKFPKSKIAQLKLEEYCVGTTDDSFCYWLEFKGILFGIGGGNASKYGIYKSKDGNFYKGVGPNKVPISGAQLDEEFTRIKTSI